MERVFVSEVASPWSAAAWRRFGPTLPARRSELLLDLGALLTGVVQLEEVIADNGPKRRRAGALQGVVANFPGE